MSFADRLKEYRRDRGFSQEDLADRLGVSRQAIGKWEQGQVYPEVEKLLALCEALHVSMDALMADELPEGCRPSSPRREHPDPGGKRDPSGSLHQRHVLQALQKPRA